MKEMKALGPDIQQLYTYIELPIGATAIGRPEGRKTGLWRYTRPKFGEKIPPCQEACPVGNWIQRFVGAAAKRDLDEAWSAVILENPFPGVCGRVCYHSCEDSCNRNQYDGATSIHLVERAIADAFFEKPLEPPIIREKRGKKVAIVGSGPAGLACAYFLRIMGYEVTLFEARGELGGIPRLAIPRYRLPRKVLEKEIKDILALGVEVRTGCRVGTDKSFSDLLAYDAVFLSTGAHEASTFKIPGADSKGVYRGLEFLAKYNLGEDIDAGEKVLVIGGGNVAIDVTRTLIRLGSSPLILYRRTRDEMPAHSGEINDAQDEGAQFQYLLSPSFIQDSGRGGLLLACKKMKIDGSDSDGRRRTVPIEGETVFFEADQIILATGEIPDLSYLPQDLSIKNGQLGVNEWGQTNIDKVFAGGDMIDQPWNVSDAIGSAKRAAIAMDHFLSGEDPRKLFSQGALARTMREHLGLIDSSMGSGNEIARFQDLNVAYSTLLSPQVPGKLPTDERIANFREVSLGLNLEAAVSEAGRCLSCGVCKKCGNCYLFCPDGAVQADPVSRYYTVNYEYCKGCGICQNECPVGAVTIETEGEE
jgi:NADPH-dependent glutamate synthase beta subunit-like oxidoreductase